MLSEDTGLTRNTNECNVRLWRRMFDSEHKVAPIGTNELRTLQLQTRASHVPHLFASIRSRPSSQPSILVDRNGTRWEIPSWISGTIRCGAVAAQASTISREIDLDT